LKRLKNFYFTLKTFFALFGFIQSPLGKVARIRTLVNYNFFDILNTTFQRLYSPIKYFWIKFFDLLCYLVKLAVTGIIYFGLLLPVALVMRATGVRFLKLGREPKSASFWIERVPPGPRPSSINRKF